MTSKKSMAISSMVFEETCPVQSNCREGVEENSKKMCEEVKCELVGYDSLTDYLKDNEFILGCYRCEWPLRQSSVSSLSTTRLSMFGRKTSISLLLVRHLLCLF